MKKILAGCLVALLLAGLLIGCRPVGGGVDVTAPTVSSTVPASAAAGVAVSAVITATFDEAMDPATITTETFVVSGPGGASVAGSVTLDADGTVATFTPASNLAGETVYTAVIATRARDAAGNPLASAYGWSFTTGDVAAPLVGSTVPDSGATVVAINVNITASFSEAMNAATITATTFKLTGPGATPVAGAVSYAGLVATFDPTANLANFTLYTATITTGAKDPAGNALASNKVWTFTTGDFIAPTVGSTVPASAATNVAVGASVTATFSEAMDAATISGTTFTLTGPGVTPVAGAVSYAGLVATFNPTASLAGSTLFTATITTGAKDTHGNALASAKVWTFTTADITAPTVSSTVPANAATNVGVGGNITATFSEAMNATTISGSTFTLTGPGVTPVTGAVSYAGVVATFNPTASLAGSTLFTATISTGAEDVAGNTLASAKVWTFTTGDVTAPTVGSTVPANAAADVAVGGNITATFSEAMNATTISGTTFTVTGPGVTPVAGAVSYAGLVATFNPTANLANDTEFTATISTGAEDVAGNGLASAKVWTFTTVAAAPAGPAAVVLGTAGNYVILAKTAISTAPTSAVTGDLGLSPAAASFITGFSLVADASNVFSTASQVIGSVYAADYAPPTPVALTTAVGDMLIAYNDAAGRPTPDVTELGFGDISGLTIVPGLYKWGTGVSINTDVTLSGGATAVWIFQIAGDVTMASATSVNLSGGALPKNIFWQIGGGSGLTVGAGAHFEGIVLAQTAITLITGASINGRMLAQTAVHIAGSAVTEPAP